MTEVPPATSVGQRKGLAAGLILTITTIAFENLGVATAMPIVADDLGGLALYGWAFTAPLLASLVGITVAGRAVDRVGPGRPFAVGLVLFTIGLATAGAAPSMPVLVAGRFVQGLGTGVIPPVAYAAIGRAFVDRARATMFALLSTAWVLPGVIGPALSGTIAEQVGWRWVFAAILPLVPLNAALAIPALLRMGPPPASAIEAETDPNEVTEGRVLLAARLALGVGLVVGGLGWRSWLAAPVVIAGTLVAFPPLRRLLPAGTLRGAPGLPAAVAARGLQTFSFFGAQAFLPLALQDVRGQRAATSGVLLTAATLTWTAGAWWQERRGHVVGRARFVQRGLTLLVVGSVVSAFVLVDAVPVPLAGAGWSIAGLGIGMSYSGLSLIVLAAAAPGREGSASAAIQLSDVLGMAVGTGLGGAAVAFGEASGASPRGGVAVAFALALVAGVCSVFTSRRLPHDADEVREIAA
jgi:MFS family permease